MAIKMDGHTITALQLKASDGSEVTKQLTEELNLQNKTATTNGDVVADAGYDGLRKVTVAVSGDVPTLITKTITENGAYNASADNADGYSSVTVNVPDPEITLQNKTVTENGTVTADAGYDGLGEVEVNVSGGEVDLDLPSDTGANSLGACYMLIDKSDKTESLSFLVFGGNNITFKTALGEIVDGEFVSEEEYENTTTLQIAAHEKFKAVKVSVVFNNQSKFAVAFAASTADVLSYRLNLPSSVNCALDQESAPRFMPSTKRVVIGGSLNSAYMSDAFSFCNADELDLSNKVEVTNIGLMFEYSLGLKSVKLNMGINANMNSMFIRCMNLRNVDFTNVSFGANAKSIEKMFQYCTKLETLDLSVMAAQSANFTNINGFNRYCSGLKTLILDGWNVGHLTTVYDVFDGCTNLENISMVDATWIASDFSLSACKKLTVASLNAVIAALPTVTSKTLTLGTTNLNKLTNEEKAVATNKGWVLA